MDGIRKSYDSDSYIQRFNLRRPKGNWSKINTEYIARLITLGKMQPSGLLEVEKARNDGRWQAAYDAPSKSKILKIFYKNFKKTKKHMIFFLPLTKQICLELRIDCKQPKK